MDPTSQLKTPAAEIRKRISRLQQQIGSRGIQGVLIVQRMDLFYFTGCAQNACLFVPREGPPLLLVKKFAARAAADSPVEDQIGIASTREIPERIRDIRGKTPRVLGLVWDALPVREFEYYKDLFACRAYVDVSSIIHGLRAVKSPWETDRLRESCRLCRDTLEHLEEKIEPGMPETHIAGIAEAFSRLHGHGGGIRVRTRGQDDRSCVVYSEEGVFSGEAAISICFRAVCNGFHAEATRVFPSGKIRGQDAEDIRKLESAHRAILKHLLPFGPRGEPAHTAAQGLDSSVTWSCRGIGLELFEPLHMDEGSKASLRPGMCLVLQTVLHKKRGRCLVLSDTLEVKDSGAVSLGCLV